MSSYGDGTDGTGMAAVSLPSTAPVLVFATNNATRLGYRISIGSCTQTVRILEVPHGASAPVYADIWTNGKFTGVVGYTGAGTDDPPWESGARDGYDVYASIYSGSGTIYAEQVLP